MNRIQKVLAVLGAVVSALTGIASLLRCDEKPSENSPQVSGKGPSGP